MEIRKNVYYKWKRYTHSGCKIDKEVEVDRILDLFNNQTENNPEGITILKIQCLKRAGIRNRIQKAHHRS